MSLHEREGQRDTQIHTYTYWRILRYMLNTRIEMIKMYFCYIYRCRRFTMTRAWGGGQTHSYGGPIFEIFFCLKDTEK